MLCEGNRGPMNSYYKCMPRTKNQLTFKIMMDNLPWADYLKLVNISFSFKALKSSVYKVHHALSLQSGFYVHQGVQCTDL